MDVTLALSNSFGFGGQNACIAFRALSLISRRRTA